MPPLPDRWQTRMSAPRRALAPCPRERGNGNATPLSGVLVARMNRTARKLIGLAASVALLAAAPLAAFAADAGLARILPRGGQRGTELEVTFSGKNLKDAQEVLFYQP